MTLTIMSEVVQGTEEWHEQRRGIVTASVVGKLITPKTLQVANNDTSRDLVATIAAERITGWTDAQYVSDDMLRGTEDEPRAIEVYSEHYAPIETVGFMVREFDTFRIGYSPDGLVGDDGLIEVKSRRSKTQVKHVVAGEAPVEHMAQMQCGLLVSGREWCDYVSFCGGMELWTVRVQPDPKWFEVIEKAARSFEVDVELMVATYRTATNGKPMTKRTVFEEIVI